MGLDWTGLDWEWGCGWHFRYSKLLHAWGYACMWACNDMHVLEKELSRHRRMDGGRAGLVAGWLQERQGGIRIDLKGKKETT